MNYGFPATVAGGALVRIPAALFAVVPGGAFVFMGIIPLPPRFPFGVPFTVLSTWFIAIPAAMLAVAPAAI